MCGTCPASASGRRRTAHYWSVTNTPPTGYVCHGVCVTWNSFFRPPGATEDPPAESVEAPGSVGDPASGASMERRRARTQTSRSPATTYAAAIATSTAGDQGTHRRNRSTPSPKTSGRCRRCGTPEARRSTRQRRAPQQPASDPDAEPGSPMARSGDRHEQDEVAPLDPWRRWTAGAPSTSSRTGHRWSRRRRGDVAPPARWRPSARERADRNMARRSAIPPSRS